MVKSVLVVSVILSITVTVSSLQCYVCYDCAEIKNEFIKSCDSISPPSNSTTTTASPSTSSTTESPSTNSSTTTTTSTTSNSSSLSTTEKTTIIDKVEENYQCFQGKIQVNNSDVIIRGCAVGRTNETCESFGLSSCSFCGTDKCNSAGSIQSSAIVLFSVVFLAIAVKG